MRVDHGRLNIVMPQKLLYGADVVAVFQQVGSERMTHRVTTDVSLLENMRFLGTLKSAFGPESPPSSATQLRYIGWPVPMFLPISSNDVLGKHPTPGDGEHSFTHGTW